MVLLIRLLMKRLCQIIAAVFHEIQIRSDYPDYMQLYKSAVNAKWAQIGNYS